MESAFCPSCGAQRVGSFRFCRNCGLDFDGLQAAADRALPPTSPLPAGPHVAPLVASATIPPAAAGTDPATFRLLTMLAWLGCALFIGWLALVQFGFAGSIFDDGSLLATGAWNAVMSVLIAFGAVRLQRSERRSSFRQSAIWAIVIILLQGFQVAQGATHFAFVGSTVAAAGAGILAWLTYQALSPDRLTSEPRT